MHIPPMIGKFSPVYVVLVASTIFVFGLVESVTDSPVEKCNPCLDRRVPCGKGMTCIPKTTHCNVSKASSGGSDQSVCQDINECESRPCQQTCKNTIGSFTCFCAEGYVMKEDGTSCKVKGEHAILIISTYKEITLKVLDTARSYHFLNWTENTILSTAFHEETSEIFWLESFINGGYVKRKDTSGGILHSYRLNNDFKNPESLAIDWMTSKLYITDYGKGIIAACSFNVINCTYVIRDPDFSPMSITLDVLHGEMYWTDWGKTPGLYKSGMDGSSVKAIVTNDVQRPSTMVIDQSTRELYWNDLDQDRIHYISLENNTVRGEIKPNNNGDIQAFAKIEDWLYHINSEYKMYVHRSGIRSKYSRSIAMANGPIVNIEIFHPALNRKGSVKNPCGGNQCSHMCLLAPNHSYSCACQKGLKLNSDGKSCS